ncbi:hypothetical protein OROGR_013393 [Orobanche gracilis]
MKLVKPLSKSSTQLPKGREVGMEKKNVRFLGERIC